MTALYIGGAFQGKTALARRLHGERAAYVENLHERVRQTLEQGCDALALLPELRGKIVVCDEVGSGIVPLDPQERAWREAVGRLCCAVADEADLVVRVWAGMPQVLKGSLPCT